MKLSYNSHYVIASEMFYHTDVHTIFQWLMDQLADLEYQAAIDKKTKRWLEDYPNSIKISISKIMKMFCIGKNRTSQIFKLYENWGLVECVRANNGRIQMCKINRPRYYSLIQFFKQSDEIKRAEFIQDLYIKGGLTKYILPVLSDAEIYAEENKPVSKLPFRVDSHSKTTPISSFDSGNDSNQQFQCSNRLEKGETELVDIPSMVRFIEENCRLESFSDEIYSISPEFWDAHAEDTDVETFLNDPERFFEDYPTFFTPFLGHFVSLKLPFGVVLNPRNCRLESFQAPYINNNNKEKSDNERSEALVEIELGVKGEEEKLSGDEPRLRKPRKKDYPYFSVQEIEEIIDDLNIASSSPLKLFLWNFWDEAIEMLNPKKKVKKGDLDEDDEDYEEDSEDYVEIPEHDYIDPENRFISVTEFGSIVRNAYDNTCGDIKKKCLELKDGGEIELKFSEIFSVEEAFQIFDWEQVVLNRKEVSVEISLDNIRNIEAELQPDIPRPKQPETRDERREAAISGRELMKKLFKAKQDKALYSQLTKIEKLAATAISEFFIPNPDMGDDDNRPFIFKNNPILSRDEYRWLLVRVSEHGLKESDLFDALLLSDGPNDAGQLPVREPMFYVEGIRFVNSKYNETSILDSIEAG